MGYDFPKVPDVRDFGKTFDVRDDLPPGGINLGTVGTVSKNQTGFSGSSSSFSGGGTQAALPNLAPPPSAPDTSTLQGILTGVQRGAQIRAALKDYDNLYASTQSSGFQGAEQAGNQYAGRLMQAGINPTSTGAVKAQARLAVYNQLDNITKEKATTRLDAINKSQALSASIAAQIAQIKQSYSSTLADYNLRQSALELNLNEFNASQRSHTIDSSRSFALQESESAARLAAAGFNRDGSPRTGGAPGSNSKINFTPGYIPSTGPLYPGSVNGQVTQGKVYQAWDTGWNQVGG